MFYVFGSCVRMLAVILVSDIFVKYEVYFASLSTEDVNGHCTGDGSQTG